MKTVPENPGIRVSLLLYKIVLRVLARKAKLEKPKHKKRKTKTYKKEIKSMITDKTIPYL